MESLRRIILPLIITMVSIPFFTSCLDEDLTDCPDEFTVSFEYTQNPSGTDLFSSVVKYLDLFVYDSNGYLFGKFTYSAAELALNDYKSKLKLPTGDYTFVVWMNNDTSSYTISGQNDITTGRQQLVATAGDVPYGTEPIYFGQGTGSYTTTNDQIVIPLIKNTKHITVNADFDTTLPAGTEVTAYITGSNGVYDFNNTSLGTTQYKYQPQRTVTNNGTTSVKFDFTTQRLIPQDDLQLVIVATNSVGVVEILKTIPLTSTIMSNPLYNNATKLDVNDEYTLDFTFKDAGNGTYVNTTIKVNDWDVTKQVTGL